MVFSIVILCLTCGKSSCDFEFLACLAISCSIIWAMFLLYLLGGSGGDCCMNIQLFVLIISNLNLYHAIHRNTETISLKR